MWDPWLRLPAVEQRLTQDLQESLADDLGVTSRRLVTHYLPVPTQMRLISSQERMK